MNLFDRPGAVPGVNAEAWTQPKVDETIPDAQDEYLATAPYDKLIHDAYEFSRDAVEQILLYRKMPGQNRCGNAFYEDLSDEHALPPIEAFSDDILDLMPWHAVMQEAGMAPEAVFAPKHFALTDWDAVQGGHPVPYKVAERKGWAIINERYHIPITLDIERPEEERTSGVESNWLAQRPVRLSPAEEGEQDGGTSRIVPYDALEGIKGIGKDNGLSWELALVSGKNAPVATDISADGTAGRSHSRKAREALGVSRALRDEQAIALMSPGMQLYNALQWKRMASGTIPVDILTRTILRNNLSHELTCTGAWHENVAGVFLGSWPADYPLDITGLRPTIRTADLEQFSLAEAA